jgi:uncharacterized membrane protein YgdD (TMEM256/DUF423 family)
LPLIAGALAGALGVGLGAFGAHGLAERLGPHGQALWDTAVQYQLVHALALLLTAASPIGARAARIAGGSFAAGILLFSGSLYLLALGGPRGLGMLAPVGGLALIGGWLALALGAWRRNDA